MIKWYVKEISIMKHGVVVAVVFAIAIGIYAAIRKQGKK